MSVSLFYVREDSPACLSRRKWPGCPTNKQQGVTHSLHTQWLAGLQLMAPAITAPTSVFREVTSSAQFPGMKPIQGVPGCWQLVGDTANVSLHQQMHSAGVMQRQQQR